MRVPSDYRRTHIPHLRKAARVLDELKTTAGCIDCGFNAWPEALQFDHVDPQSKQHSLGWVRDRSKLVNRSRLERYLDHVSRYCVVRCANCHAHRTMEEQHWRVRRGEAAGQCEGDTLF